MGLKNNYPDLGSKNLLGDEAEHLVEYIMSKCKDRNGKYSITKNQIRRFFTEVTNIKRRMEGLDPDSVINDENFARIKLLKAKAIYNSQRQNNIPQAFCEFISRYIDDIKANDTNKKFVRFCQLFEAFVGYSSAFKLRD